MYRQIAFFLWLCIRPLIFHHLQYRTYKAKVEVTKWHSKYFGYDGKRGGKCWNADQEILYDYVMKWKSKMDLEYYSISQRIHLVHHQYHRRMALIIMVKRVSMGRLHK